MTQPTQEYPPWLTPVPSVVTNAAGMPISTSTSVAYIAPTYYGPSIPLGSLYSYGGSTYPPTVVLPGSTPPTVATGIPTTTGIPITTAATTTGTFSATTGTVITTAIPPTGTSVSSPGIPVTTVIPPTAPPTTTGIPVTTAIPTTTSAITPATSVTTTTIPTVTSVSSLTSLTTSTSLISPPIFSSSSTTTSPTSTPSGIAQAAGLTRGQLVGIIVASILGLIFLFVLGLFFYLWLKALKNRRHYQTLTPIDDDYIVVPGSRVPGEGSPRHSGEEGDPFLQPRAETSAAGAAMLEVSRDIPSRPPGRAPPGTANSGSSASTNSHASGFGELIDRPSLGILPSMPEEERTGQPLPPTEMGRLGHEQALPDDPDLYDENGRYTGAYAYSQGPPAVASPSRPHDSHISNISSIQGEQDAETATVHTARRVKVEDLGPRSISEGGSEAGPSRSSTGILAAIGLGGLADIARKSWFKNFDSPRQSTVVPSYSVEPLSEKDLEAGRSLLATHHGDSPDSRPREASVGIEEDRTRPLSGISARSGASGATQYHDAESSLRATPTLTPLPRAVTPAEQPSSTSGQTHSTSPLAGPPAYEEHAVGSSTPPLDTSQSASNLATSVDILDMPAPTALNHFASLSSLRESHSGSSFGTKPFFFPPPGLETIRAVGWSDSATETTSRGSFNLGYAPIVDILEEGPPEAEHGWRSISSDTRRGTFGAYVQGFDFMSEQASLHSMRSHMSPSMRSTGSAAAGRFEAGSLSSNASRPSANSRSASSGVHSLIHKGSISSDSRRKPGGSATHSPALSAFGIRPSSHASPSPAQDRTLDPPLSPTIGSLPIVHVSPNKSSTIRSGSPTLLDSSTRTVRGIPNPFKSHSASPLRSSPVNAPWTGVVDQTNDWRPVP